MAYSVPRQRRVGYRERVYAIARGVIGERRSKVTGALTRDTKEPPKAKAPTKNQYITTNLVIPAKAGTPLPFCNVAKDKRAALCSIDE